MIVDILILMYSKKRDSNLKLKKIEKNNDLLN